MTSDTHGPTFSILAGVLKPKRASSSWRRSAINKSMAGVKASRTRHKKHYPITLPTKPYDHTGDDQ